MFTAFEHGGCKYRPHSGMQFSCFTFYLCSYGQLHSLVERLTLKEFQIFGSDSRIIQDIIGMTIATYF